VGAPGRTVVVDANIIINLIHIGRLSLLTSIPGYDFVLPVDVGAEIRQPEQRSELDGAVSTGTLRVESITDFKDLTQLAELRTFLGRGEAACLVLAERHGWVIASDERRRFRREVIARIGQGRLVTTPGLLVLAIRAGALTVDEADVAKAVLERQRFRMAFKSFHDVIGDPTG
jgi:predicted nucleic acid-binding protein